jgi:hypothetical protein
MTLIALAACGRIDLDPRELDVDAPVATFDAPAIADADPAAPDADPSIDARVDAAKAAVCPDDTTPISDGSLVCVEKNERGTDTWTAASDTCNAAGRRLCSDAEWALACANATDLVDMANDGGGTTREWEWVAEMSAGTAWKRGYTACDETASHSVDTPYDYRCCVDI